MDLRDFLYIRKHVYKETARSIAKKLGITEQHLNKLAQKAYSPSIKLAKKIEDFTGGKVTRMELLYPTPD